MACNRRHIVVSDTSTVLGLSVAESAAAEGFHVLAGHPLEGGRRPGRVADTEPVTTLRLDLSDPVAVAAAARAMTTHAGADGIDALVTTVPLRESGPLEFTDIATLEAALTRGVVGPLTLTQALLPALRAGGGRIVLAGVPVLGYLEPFAGPDSAAAAALASLHETLRAELADDSVEVVTVTETDVAAAPAVAAAAVGAAAEGRNPRWIPVTLNSPRIVALTRLPQALQYLTRRTLFGLPGVGTENTSAAGDAD